jgi:hypothetical protein
MKVLKLDVDEESAISAKCSLYCIDNKHCIVNNHN